MFKLKKYFIYIFCIILEATTQQISSNNVCYSPESECVENSDNKRFLFYDVNPPEGFNLRRDVYLRYATFAHKLQKSTNDLLKTFQLVLPPWSHLYHWERRKDPHYFPWSRFFDFQSLKLFAPVIEMHQFFDLVEVKYSKINIGDVYILQHFEDMFASGKFEDKMSIEKCQEEVKTKFFFYNNITSNNIKCLSFHGHASRLSNVLQNSPAKTILIDHAEIALHDSFGDKTYWQARRSMRFNKELVNAASSFRAELLNSTDEIDKTVLPSDWRKEKPGRKAIGGPYLSVHLRRKDFLWGRSKEVPFIPNAAKQINELLHKLKLSTVFVATDAPEKEYLQLIKLISPSFTVVKFKLDVGRTYNEGEIAILEQIICSHARFFIGTYESTFTFRIQEEREIMGFKPETTFNRLCGNDKSKCVKPTVWKIVY